MTSMSETMNEKVSIFIAKFLKCQGVHHVFELSGGMIMDMIDSLYVEGGIGIVNVHHEQSASFAAEAVGRLSGRPGVALATSGPGATNLLTGIASCFFDSSPAVFITGQVKRNEQKLSASQRQSGFQETDIVAMALPVTKWAYQVRTPEEVPAILAKAFQVAMEGRPGPVLVDIPMDVFRARIDFEPPAFVAAPKGNALGANDGQLADFVAALRQARKPMVLAGGGVRAARANEAFRSLVKALGVPVVYSLMAIDALGRDEAHHVGLIGTYGNRWSNTALAEADLVLVVGSRLDIRQTGADVASFKGARPIYQVDIDVNEINSRVKGCHPVVMDVLEFCEALTGKLAGFERPDWSEWEQRIAHLRAEWPDIQELPDCKGLNPNHLMHALSRDRRAGAYAIDVGNHQMWAAQSLEIHAGQAFLTSGGMGAMGFALPAAIGAALHLDKKVPVMVIAGDGGFQLSLHELQTVVRNKLPLKIVVFNNGCHGMTRQFQDTYFEKRYQGTVWGYDAPDFEKVARGFGIDTATLRVPEGIPDALTALWSSPLEPFLLQVMVDTHTNVYPKIAFGKPISEMEPQASPIEMEGT